MNPDLSLLARQWSGNHRRFGLRAALRCLNGERRLRARRPEQSLHRPGIESLTFSVVPGLTSFWYRTNLGRTSPLVESLTIGDCSGALEPTHLPGSSTEATVVIPCLNRKHGEKLDFFVRHVMTREVVLICDDDVYFLSARPLEWAIRQVRKGRAVAASIRPRRHTSSLLEGVTDRAMGSACLLIDRQRWLEQDLSFAVRASDRPDADWYYDTGDWANRQLIERNLTVALIPSNLSSDVVSPRAMSTWLLKFHKHPVEKLPEIADNPFRRSKARRAFLVAREIERRQAGQTAVPPLLPHKAVDRLDAATSALLTESQNSAVEDEVGRLFRSLDSAAARKLGDQPPDLEGAPQQTVLGHSS